MRSLIGLAFLLAQLFSVVYAQFGPSRYFCWVPNDYMVSYRLEVNINGRLLSSKEITGRYHVLKSSGVYQNVVKHLKNIVQQYETTYGRNDHAQVLLKYSTNGHQEKQWKWPPV